MSFMSVFKKKKTKNSRVVTIRQRAESVSIWEGTDHLLVCHHPGSGIVHLSSVKKMVQRHIFQNYLNHRIVSYEA